MVNTSPVRALLSLLLALPCACVTPGSSSYSYEAPTPVTVENSALVPIDFNAAWDQLVKELATRFYVINNIDKESRIINVSFSSTQPEQYLTGGRTTRRATIKGQTEEFKYDPAASSVYKQARRWGDFQNLPVTDTISRSTSVEGRANIYVAPQDASTLITANCRYLLTVRSSGVYEAFTAFGTLAGRGSIPESSATASFSTNEPCQVNWGTPAEPAYVSFCSTGRFESEILSILKQKSP